MVADLGTFLATGGFGACPSAPTATKRKRASVSERFLFTIAGVYPAIAWCEKNRCIVPHSRHQKWIESRRAQGLGVSQTGQRVSFCGKGRWQWSQETGPLRFTSSSQLTSLHDGQPQQPAISLEIKYETLCPVCDT